MPTNLSYPYRFDGRGGTAVDGEDAYLRGLIEQVLFTAPGERVMRPGFGSGLMQLIFAPNSPELAAATEFLALGALQEWLGNLIAVTAVEVQAQDASLRVSVNYVVRRTQTTHTATFERGGPGQ